MDVACRMLRCLAASMILCSATLASVVEQLAISQANVDVRIPPPKVTAYLDTLDVQGQPVTTLRASELSGSFGVHPLTLASIKAFETSGEGVAYIFLIDVSGSIGPSQFPQMTAAISAWIDDLKPSDRVAIFAFGDDCRMISDFTANKASLNEALAALAPKATKTMLHNALVQAMSLNSRGDEALPARRVIVVLSDGKDEGSGRTVEDVLEVIRNTHMPIYTIGYSRLPLNERQQYLAVMHRFADNSGGIYREAGSEPLQDIYADIRQAIRRVWIATFVCPDCEGDNRYYTLRVSLAGAGGHELSSDAEVRIPRFTMRVTTLAPWWKRWWVFSAAGGLVAAVILIVILAERRKQPEIPPITSNLSQENYVPPPFEPVGRHLRLVVTKGMHPGKTHELRLAKRAVIGRNSECDVILKDDGEASGRHCELALVDGRVFVCDLKSRNGTSVNGVPITNRYRLENGDLILVGRTELRITIQDAV